MEHAAAYDLQFLADMNSTFFDTEVLDADSARVLSALEANWVIREQYLISPAVGDSARRCSVIPACPWSGRPARRNWRAC